MPALVDKEKKKRPQKHQVAQEKIGKVQVLLTQSFQDINANLLKFSAYRNSHHQLPTPKN